MVVIASPDRGGVFVLVYPAWVVPTSSEISGRTRTIYYILSTNKTITLCDSAITQTRSLSSHPISRNPK
ncbi:hypothetical protein RSAG8_10050, partial [Rhizoctonia solani AG-8 WAC10335]